MPTRPKPPPLRAMTLGDDGAVQLEISGDPQPLVSLNVNGVDIDPAHVIAPMTATHHSSSGQVRLDMSWLVDAVLMTTADGITWRLDSEGTIQSVPKENPHD